MEMHTRESLLRAHGIESLPNSSFRPIGGGLTRFLRRLWDQHKKERLIRRQIWELQRSDDWVLRDIGISRWEIEAIVRGDRSAAVDGEGPGK